MKKILFAVLLSAFSSFQLYCQIYNIYSQTGNFGYGGAYVAPVTTKTYVFKSAQSASSAVSSAPTSRSSSSSGGSSSSPTSSTGSYLYRNSWTRKLEKMERKALLIAQQKTLAAQAWKTQADAVIANYRSGNFLEAENIRASISMHPPGGVGDIVKMEHPDPNGYNPASMLGAPFEKKYERAYHFTCILLFAELRQYKKVIDFYHLSFSDANVIGKSKLTGNNDNYKYNHEERTPLLVECFKDLSYSDILKLETAFIEALKHDNGIGDARKRWIAISNFYLPYIEKKVTTEEEKSLSYNILAMVQLQLGNTEDAIIYFQKQLNLRPSDEQLHFAVFQNLVEFILSTPQKNDQLSKYCLQGLDKILQKAIAKESDPEYVFSIRYNKAIVLLANDECEKAETVVNSQRNIPTQHLFAHNILKSNILIKTILQLGILSDIPTERQKRAKEYVNYTPAQQHEFDSLFVAGYFDNEPKYTEIILKKKQELLDLTDDMMKGYALLSEGQKVEMDVFNAEYFLFSLKDYSGAKLSYEIAIMKAENKWPYQMRLAEINVMEENYKAAIAILSSTIANNTEEYQLYSVLADTYRKAGQSKKAKENYTIASNKGAFLTADVLLFLNGE